jgi:DNA invertase Pin-like site-specific DNA recombinase
LDRLFRSTVDALQRVEDWSKTGVALHLVDLGGQAVDTSNGMGRFFLTMLAGLAELERAQISERTTAVLAHKRANAQRISLHAPYGWRISRNGKDLLPVEAEQRVLKLIDALKADGHSVRSIARALEARGCKPRGSRWHTNTVHRLLHRKPVGVGV